MNDGRSAALVLGATSDIGRAIARDGGRRLRDAACGRDPARLEREARDLRVRTGAVVTVHCGDVLRDDGGVSMLDALDPLPEVAVCAVGLLGDQTESWRTLPLASRHALSYTKGCLGWPEVVYGPENEHVAIDICAGWARGRTMPY